MVTTAAIENVAAGIEVAAGSVGRAVAERRVQTEDDFTSRLLDRIEASVDGQRVDGFMWRAMKLTDRGPTAQESEFGADLLGVLSVRTHTTSLAKGFLAQAKLLGVGKPLKMAKLRAQCDDMLRHTPDSFVLFYDTRGVRVASALAVARSTTHPRDLPRWTRREFFIAHFSCFVGDERLSVPTPEALDAIRREFRARDAISIEVSELEGEN